MKQLLVLLALLVASVSAQATAVTATLTYSDSQVLAGATISADFVPSPTGGLPASAYLLSGSAFTQHVTATANSSGVFTMTLSDDRVVTPSGGRWQFTICTPTASPCFSSVQDVFGTSINLSTALSAAAPTPGGPATSNNVYYADAEVAPAQAGSIYFNYVSSTFRCYNGSAWATCSGGSGTVTNIATTSPIGGGPITGTGTLTCTTCGVTGSPLSQFAATTSSQLAGIVSDETGSGSLVFGTSPTLTTAALGASTATTQAGGDSSTKLATTAFVASAIQGVNPAVAVQAATTGVLPNSPTYNNGASGIGAFLTTVTLNTALVVDGYTPVLNDRVLVKNQASSFQNGVYTVSQVSGVGVAWILTRALDFDQPSDMNNTGAIPVLNGTVNAVTQWVISSSVTTVGTDAVTFTQFSSNPANNVSDGLAFGTPAIGATASAASIATNSITVATTGVVYVFCGSWGSGTATLTLTDTLSSTITSIGDTGDNTTSFNSRMHAWKVVPASSTSDAFTCAGAAAGSHMDIVALYYPTAGNKTVDVNIFGNVNADQTGKNLSVSPSTTDRIILALFSVNGSADRFSGFSGFNFPVFQNQTTSGNSFFVWERPNFPAGTFSPTAYGISNQPMHMAILGVN